MIEININTNIWTGQCVQDSIWERLLPTQIPIDLLTPAKSIKACNGKGFSFAGVQYYSECFCGNEEPPTDRILETSRCTYGCVGDRAQRCGGSQILMNVYKIMNK